MGKIKSAICLTLITLVIAVLCVVCFVPFPTDSDGIHFYNPLINWTEKSADLGGYLYGGSDPGYVGGSYSAVLYPEGVISAREYADNLAQKEGEEKADYEAKYVAYGSLYLEKETVTDGGETPTEEFKTAFGRQVEVLKARFESVHEENTALEIRDDYTVRAALPATLDTAVASFLYFSYMGEVTVSYGTSNDAASATQVLPETSRGAGPITDYIDSVSTRMSGTTPFVQISFTDKGLDLVAEATSGAAESAGYLFVQVGGNTVINLSVSEEIHDDLYISGSYTADSAAMVAVTLSTAMKYGSEISGMTVGRLTRGYANFGDNALMFAYIAVGVAFVLMVAAFFIRYRRLGFAHLYSCLIFLLVMTLCFWSIGLGGGIAIGAGTLAAFALTFALLCVCNAYAFENARKEYALGKTMMSSVKTGYSKCFWHIFDLHVTLLIAGLLTWLIAITELSAFALAFSLGVFFSGLCTLVVNRFLWYIMMPFAKDAGKFCHFKREEVEDDE